MATDMAELIKSLYNEFQTPVKEEETTEEIYIPGNLSIESTLKEIEILTKRLHARKNDPLAQAKLVQLLEVKCKLLGMFAVKPDVQEMVDTECNNYKKKILYILSNHFGQDGMNLIIEKLTENGL